LKLSIVKLKLPHTDVKLRCSEGAMCYYVKLINVVTKSPTVVMNFPSAGVDLHIVFVMVLTIVVKLYINVEMLLIKLV
jgi:hypothetical protein